jgi:hypothetical protein
VKILRMSVEALPHLKDETQRWSKVVKDSGAKPE